MPRHVLIVEDSDLVSGALLVLVESIGSRVTVAATVAQAIEAVDRDPPDVVLLDVTLPDGSGIDVARHTRAVAPAAVVIALTGHDSSDVADECRAGGCHEVLVKPVSIRVLRELLDGL